MKESDKRIGFDRTIHLEWLATTAELAMHNYSPQEINQKLDTILMEQIKGKEARRKTRTVLLAIWVKIKKEFIGFRADAFELLQSASIDKHLAIHWGMSMAIHPFFGHVAKTIGRLINIQEMLSAAEVQRRIREVYGERQTVSRAVQRLLRTFVQWGVLNDMPDKGIYSSGVKINITDKHLISWLIEASLYANENTSGMINNILKSPIFFPFIIKNNKLGRDLTSKRLEIIRHGMDEDLIVKRNSQLWNST